MVKLGDKYRLPHPRTGDMDAFEVINVSGPRVELKATGAYPSEIDKTVSCREEDIAGYKI